MTNDITPILEKYNASDLKSMMDKPDIIMRDVALLGEAIPELEGQQKEVAQNLLQQLLETVEIQIHHLQATMDGHEQKMDNLKKMSAACAAYSKPNKKGRE